MVNLGFAWILKIVIDEAIPQKQIATLFWAIIAFSAAAGISRAPDFSRR
ncbi:hypothetical protein [Sporomusa ovata]|nr:hypothetical protein [Sporomusa ovata]